MKHFSIKALCMAAAAAVLFILCFSLAKGTKENTADSTTAYNLSAWLAKHEISIDRELIDTDTQTVLSAAMRNAAADRQETAAAILGESVQGTAADTYTGKNGTVVFSKDAFTLTPNDGLFSDIASGIDRYNCGKKAERMAKSLGFDLSGSVISSKMEDGSFSSSITKTIDSKPVFNDAITLVIRKDGLVSASGVWYIPYGRGQSRTAKSAADALAELLKQVQNSGRVMVQGMTLGYVMEQRGNGIGLKPVWKFELDGRDDVYIDA